ncbi:hypothetical protein SFR_2053 [Streptomyces sp. FR-008]|nr:hypothetical protein SFR_2053 [Streptomyces sp. FR-008]
MRPCGVLRLLAVPARDGPLPRERPPGDAQRGAGRVVALVLRGRFDRLSAGYVNPAPGLSN